MKWKEEGAGLPEPVPLGVITWMENSDLSCSDSATEELSFTEEQQGSAYPSALTRWLIFHETHPPSQIH